MAIEVAASRRLFTREEYYRMGEVGILKRSDRGFPSTGWSIASLRASTFIARPTPEPIVTSVASRARRRSVLERFPTSSCRSPRSSRNELS